MERKSHRRYRLAFAALVLLLAGLAVWNINSGSIHLSIKEIFGILAKHEGGKPPTISYGKFVCRGFWQLLYWVVRCLYPAFFCRRFFQSNCRTFRSGDFIRRQAGGIPGDDLAAGKSQNRQLGGFDTGCICGRNDLYGFRSHYFQKSKEDVHAGNQRCYDRVYLLRNYRFCHYFCR